MVKRNISIYTKFFGNNKLNFKIPKKPNQKQLEQRRKELLQMFREEKIIKQAIALEDYRFNQTKSIHLIETTTLDLFFKELMYIGIKYEDAIILDNEFKRIRCSSIEKFLRDHRVFYESYNGEYLGPVYHLEGLSRVTQFILRIFHSLLIKSLPDSGHRRYMFANLDINGSINEYELMKITCYMINTSNYLCDLIKNWLRDIHVEKEYFVYFLNNLDILI
jgi:hypothetical protein